MESSDVVIGVRVEVSDPRRSARNARLLVRSMATSVVSRPRAV